MRDIPGMPAPLLAAFAAHLRKRYDAFVARGLRLNMARGKPSPAQLDLSAGLFAVALDRDYTTEAGVDCRNYEGVQGIPEARALFAPMMGAPPEQVVVANNASLALMHDCVTFALLKGTPESTRPWSKEDAISFLCPVPGYDRHFTICEQYGIRMIPVPMTDDGPDLALVSELVRTDRTIKGMWCVPKYSNPTGAVYSDETVERLAAMPAAAADFRIFWDNAYAVHDLTDEGVAVANVIDACARHGKPNRPFVFASTSKITLAGGGLAMFASSPDNVAWLTRNMSCRTIGPDKLNQLRHVRFLRNHAGIARLMKQHREILAPKFERVIEVLTDELGGRGIATWTRPRGGYFISLDVMDGCASRVVALAKDAGIILTPAGATHPLRLDPSDKNIRIAPSYPDLEELTQAAEGVCLSVLLACTEKTLASR